MPIHGLDHAIIATHDLDRSAAIYERLGFIVGPVGHHPSLGSSNRLIMFENDYLELLKPGPANGWSRYFHDLLTAGGSGAAGLALRIDNAEAFVAHARANGFAPEAPVTFGRPVTMPDGKTDEARFEAVMLPDGALPGAKVFGIRHLTPHLVFSKPPVAHPIGAFRMAGVIFAFDPVPASARPYERLLDRVARGSSYRGVDLLAVNVLLICMWPNGFDQRYPTWAGLAPPPPRIAGFCIQVADLDATARHLRDNGIGFVGEPATGFVIDPAFTDGTLIELL
jgi:catechol 2,3-dioxygenase-like lactoylglutathione lyase family enzyme